LRNATESVTANLGKLYNFLLKPLEQHLSGYNKLIFVPHRILHQLPFHALFNQETKKFLIEEWEEISYLPSSNLLGICQRRGTRTGEERGRGALVMGYSNNGSLVQCTAEAQTVAALLEESGLEGQHALYLEENATTTHFEAEAGGKLILHVATHAGLRQDNPLFSALELADGQITALDLLNSQLKAGLITLSACQTGLAKLGGGDELLGLSRACIYAGASTLILSLWKVEDNSAARFMQEFYREILEGKRKAAALREAQLALLCHEDYRHPFFWAPFTLVGHTGIL
jgi:CHAT domain-containing protein